MFFFVKKLKFEVGFIVRWALATDLPFSVRFIKTLHAFHDFHDWFQDRDRIRDRIRDRFQAQDWIYI